MKSLGRMWLEFFRDQIFLRVRSVFLVHVEFIGFPKLPEEILSEISLLMEKNIRRNIFSKIPEKFFLEFCVVVEAESNELLTLNVEVNCILSPGLHLPLDDIIDEAVSSSFVKVEDFFKDLKASER